MTEDWKSKRKSKTCGSELARESSLPEAVMLTVPPPSRASSLPQGISGRRRICEQPQSKTVGASLLANAVYLRR